MVGTAGEAAETAAEGEFEEIVVRVTDDRAVVFSVPSGETRWRWGRWLPDLTSDEVTKVLRALDPAVRAVIDVKRLTARLVEVDPLSRALWQNGFEGVTEASGWMQSTLRDRGQFLRVIRIRPATALTAVAGGVSALAAVAAQVQAAEMASDLRAIREGVGDLSRHLQDEQVGTVNAAVEQAGELVEMIRRHGREGIESGAFTTLQNDLRKSAKVCQEHLQAAMEELGAAQRELSPFQAERRVRAGTVDRVLLNLHLLGHLHTAMVQLGLAQVALYLAEGNVAVAKSHVEIVALATGTVRNGIQDAFGRIESMDAQLRSLFDQQRRSRVLPAAQRGLAWGGRFPATKSIPIPGTAVRIPSVVVSTAVALMPAVYLGVNALVQSNAETKLDKEMVRLTRTSDLNRAPVDAAMRSLCVLQDLVAELGGPVDQ